MSSLNSDYGPTFNQLLEHSMSHDIGRGQPDKQVEAELKALDLDAAFTGKLEDRLMGLCCWCGLWLGFDHLNDSHMISQAIENSTGSFWHGIMHRREGDYWNSKYWFRQVGDHPVIAQITEAFPDYEGPFKFVDRVEAIIQSPGREYDRCMEIQAMEWQLLFDYCYHSAIQP